MVVNKKVLLFIGILVLVIVAFFIFKKDSVSYDNSLSSPVQGQKEALKEYVSHLELKVISDTYTQQANPTNNQGSATQLRLLKEGGTTTLDGFMMFNLSGLSTSGFKSAELRFYILGNSLDTSSEGFNVTTHRIFQYPTYNITDVEWNETAIVWDNQPNATTHYNATASDKKTYYGGTSEPTGWQSFNVTSIVLEDLLAGNLNTSILLNSTEHFGSPLTTDYLIVSTKEGSLAFSPYLVLDYDDNVACNGGKCIFDYEDILEDVGLSEGTFYPQGDSALMSKWNISQLCSISLDSIDSIVLEMYIEAVSGVDNDSVQYYIGNQTWHEGLTTPQFDTIRSTWDTANHTITNNQFSSITANTFTNITMYNSTIYEVIVDACGLGNTNLSFWIHDPDQQVTASLQSSDAAGVTRIIGDQYFLVNNYLTFTSRHGFLPTTARLYINYTENTPPSITFVSPTPNNEYINYSNITINITCDQTCHTAILDWNGTNESMSGSGINWYKSKNITNGNYTFQVYANSSAGLMNVSQTRWVWKNIPVSTVNESATNVSKTIYTYPTTSVNQTFHWYGDLNRDIDKCIFDWNGTNYTSNPNGLNCSYTINITSKGNYTFTAYINDSSGEVDSSNTYSLKFFFAKDPAGYWVARAPVDPAEIDAGDYLGRRGGYEGNGQDTGVLLRDDTLDDYGNLLQDEERHCGAWGVWYFNEDNYTEGEIEEMYCKGWGHSTNTASAGAKIGFDNSDKYDASTFDLGAIQFQTTPSFPNNATQYYLIVYNDSSFDYEYDDDYDANTSLWDVAFKVSGGDIQLLSYPNQKTYCIVNNIGGIKLSNQTGLSAQDTDGDGVDDWTELYTTYTDPYDVDTDNDTRDDDFERDNSKKGYDPYDWGTIHYYYANDSSFNITYKLLNNQTSEPSVDKPNVTLSTEFNSTQYNNLRYYDDVNTILPFNVSTGSARWGLDQVNLNVTISQDVDSIQYVNIFMGGKASGSYSGIDLEENVIRALNISSGTNDYIASGKKWVTRAIFLEQVRENFTDLVDDNNRMFVTWYNKVNKSIDGGYVDYLHYFDYAEIWVITGGSLVSIVAPTTASPLTVENSTFIMVNYTLTEEGTTIVSGVTTQNITIDGELCTLNGVASYSDSKWQQNCTTPNKVSGSYDLQIYANTSSSGFLTDTETDAITYSGATTIIISDGIVNQDFLNRKGSYIRNALDSFTSNDIIAKIIKFLRTPFDSLEIVSNVIRNFLGLRTNIDSVNTNDILSRITLGFINLNDQFSVDDSLIKLRTVPVTSSESLTLADLITRIFSGSRENVDTLNSDDNILKTRTVPLISTDSLNTQDTISRQTSLLRSPIDSFTFADLVSRLTLGFINLNDQVVSNDENTRLLLTDRNNIETLVFNDELLTNKKIIREPNEEFSISAIINRIFLGLRTSSDSFTVQDQDGRSLLVYRNPTDQVSLFEEILRKLFIQRTEVDSIEGSDEILKIRTIPKELSDSVETQDILTKGFFGVRTNNEGFFVADIISYLRGVDRNMIDSIDAQDNLIRRYSAIRSPLDSFNIDTLISRLFFGFKINTDSLTSSDSVERVLLVDRDNIDTVSVDDTNSRTYSGLRVTPEPFTINDLVARLSLGFIRISDSSTLQDIQIRQTTLERLLTAPFTINLNLLSLYTDIGNLFSRAAIDSLTIQDTLTRQTSLLRSPIDSFTFADLVSRLTLGFINLNDQFSADDLIDSTSALNRNNIDTLALNDLIDSRRGVDRSISEQFSTNDLPSRIAYFGRSITDIFKFFYSLLSSGGSTPSVPEPSTGTGDTRTNETETDSEGQVIPAKQNLFEYLLNNKYWLIIPIILISIVVVLIVLLSDDERRKKDR